MLTPGMQLVLAYWWSRRRDGRKTSLKCFRGVLGCPAMGCTELQHAQHSLISLEMQVEEPLMPKEDRLSKTSISVALGGWGGCTRWDVPRNAMKRRPGSSWRQWIIFALCCGCFCLLQSSPWWLWPGSEQRVMGESCSVLTAHSACWISKAQANRGFTAWD